MDKKPKIFGHTLALTWGDICFTLALIAFGVVLIVWPNAVKEYLLVAIGTLTMLSGLGRIIRYFRATGAERMMNNDFVSGLFWFVLGLVVILGRETLSALLTYMFGLVLVVAAAFYVQGVLDMRYMKSDKWVLHLVAMVISLAFGIVIFAVPNLPMIVIGIALVVEGILYAVARGFFNRVYDKMSNPTV